MRYYILLIPKMIVAHAFSNQNMPFLNQNKKAQQIFKKFAALFCKN